MGSIGFPNQDSIFFIYIYYWKQTKCWKCFIFPRVWMSGNLGDKSFTYELKLSCSTQTKDRWSVNHWWQYIPYHWEDVPHEIEFALTLVIYNNTQLAHLSHLISSTLSLDQARPLKSIEFVLHHLTVSYNCFYQIQFWFYATS